MEAEKARAARAPRARGKVVLATVKGDVHDIGKNIVGVVLGCNNYEVVDLGVMVPAERILETAVEEQARRRRPLRADHAVARRDGRRRTRDGASRDRPAAADRRRHDVTQHTAVRIAPAYSQPVVHVLDASRVVGVVSDLLDPARRDATRRREPRRPGPPARPPRREGAQAAAAARWRARENRRPRRASTTCPRRRSPVAAVVEPDLATLREYIDWQFFFHAWELKGKFPAILEQPAARELFDDAQRAARRDRRRAAPHAHAASIGFWPRRRPSVTTSSWTRDTRFSFLRQQADYGDSRPNRSLADFVAPDGRPPRRVRGHGRHRRRRARRVVRGGARRLPRDHGQGARRPPRRGVRRVPARARAARVVRAGRERSLPSELIAERFRGHPAGVRLSGLSGPHARSRSCSRCSAPRRPGIALTESLRDDAGGERERHLPRASRRALLLRRAHRPRPGRGLRGAKGHDARRGRALAASESRLRTDPR